MISKTIFPGRYIQGYDAITELCPEITRLGGRTGFLLCSPTVFRDVFPQINEEISKAVNLSIMQFQGECCDQNIDHFSYSAQKANSDVIVGMGGGKTLDTAKAIAYKLKLPVIIVPTIASSDAPCTALSVIYSPDGKFERLMTLPHNPDVVLVDTKIIVQAPFRFLVAGMGDALSTFFEAKSCQQKCSSNCTGFPGSSVAYDLAHLCYQTLINYGHIAKKACEAHLVVPAVEHIVEANTLLSGLGHESGGTAGAHAVQVGLTAFKSTHSFLHGEKVAFGTLTSLFLTDQPQTVIDEVYSFCESVGLPTTLAEVGLLNTTDEDILKLAQTTYTDGMTMHNEIVPVSAESIFAAIKMADLEGQRRK